MLGQEVGKGMGLLTIALIAFFLISYKCNIFKAMILVVTIPGYMFFSKFLKDINS